MAKVNETELGDDFSYILRLADSDIDGLRPIAQGLTSINGVGPVSYTHLRAHETPEHLVCRLVL